MRIGSLFWMMILAISAAAFFGIAAVVTIKGVSDLRDLLE